MKLYPRRHEIPDGMEDDVTFWPQDRLDDIDDEEFARAIAAGRAAEQEELVSAS